MNFNEVILGKDCKYRWIQQINLYKDIMLPLEVWKVFAISSAVPVVILMLMSIAEGSFAGQFLVFIKIYFLQISLLTLFTAIGYYLFFVPFSGKYAILLYEMDTDGISYYQFKKDTDLEWLKVQADILSEKTEGDQKAAAAGLGRIAARGMYAGYDKVKKIIIYKRFGVIKLILKDRSRSIIYPGNQELLFIFGYIKGHCLGNAKIIYRP